MDKDKLRYEVDCNLKDLIYFISEVDSFFKPRLSSRVNIEEYALKLYSNAEFFCIYENDKLVTALIYYVDISLKESYIPIIATLKSHRGRGLISYLLKELDKVLIKKGIKKLRLETWEGNKVLNFYLKNAFVVEDRLQDREDGNFSIKLVKTYDKIDSYPIIPTALEFNERLNKELKSSIYIKRDDLFPISGGGSKGRKLKFILKKAVNEGCTAIVTAGSCQSNHLRATAVLCAELGLKFTACIHDEKPEKSYGNLKLIELYSSKVVFCQMLEIKKIMDLEMNELIRLGEKPFYIWGGGHSDEGTFSYYSAIKELKDQMKTKELDYIFVATGTGGTQAGIEIGVRKFFPNCRVIGVSIARNQKRGIEEVVKSIDSLGVRMNIKSEKGNIVFDDNYLFGGYGQVTEKYLEELKYYAINFGLILDPVYSGKAFYAMIDYIKSDKLQNNSNIVFWNTGGILNVSSSDNF